MIYGNYADQLAPNLICNPPNGPLMSLRVTRERQTYHCDEQADIMDSPASHVAESLVSPPLQRPAGYQQVPTPSTAQPAPPPAPPPPVRRLNLAAPNTEDDTSLTGQVITACGERERERERRQDIKKQCCALYFPALCPRGLRALGAVRMSPSDLQAHRAHP